MDISDEDFKRFRSGDKFKAPEHPDELYLMVISFFHDIHEIVSKHNHFLKYDGRKQVMDILNDAAVAEGINLTFAEQDGEWGLLDTGYTKEDFLSLPQIKHRFSRIYRHHAKEYSYGDEEDIKELIGDTE